MLGQKLIGSRTLLAQIVGSAVLLTVLLLKVAPEMNMELVWTLIAINAGGQAKQTYEAWKGKRAPGTKTRATD
jgi:hypothetical protein